MPSSAGRRSQMLHRMLNHGPLLLAAFLCEVGLLIYTFAYERQIAPVGVFSLMGLAGTGGLTLLIELLKLPLAVHSNGTRGLYRIVVMGFVLLLCGMTFMTVKDLVNNQAILSLAPANGLLADANLLEAENRNLEMLRDRRTGDAAAAREEMVTTQRTAELRLTSLRDERAAEATIQEARLAAARKNIGLDLAAVSQIQSFAAARDQVLSDAELDFARIDQRLSEERRAHSATVAQAAQDHLAQRAAWEQACESIRARRAADRDAAAASVGARMAVFERTLAAYEASAGRLAIEREKITAELARRIAAHEASDGAFYNLSGKIKGEKSWAAAEFDRIDAAGSRLIRPASPTLTSGTMKDLDLPARPVPTRVESPEIDRLLAERRTRMERRDTQLVEIDARVAAIRDAANRANADQAQSTSATIATIAEGRDRQLVQFDDAIANESRRLTLDLESLRSTAATPAEVQAYIQSSTETIDGNLVEIERLRHEAVKLREKTEMHRLADFLRPFMPQATWEARAEVAQAGQSIVLAFIAAIAPAFLLKMAMYHLMVSSHDAPRRGRRQIRTGRIARLRRRQAEELNRRDADATEKIRQESFRNEAVEAEGRRIAELGACEIAEIRAGSERRLLEMELLRDTNLSQIGIEKDQVIAAGRSEVDALKVEIEGISHDRDAAIELASKAAAEVSRRHEELEATAIRRQQLRDQQLQDAVEHAERRAKSSADRRIREDVATLRARIECLEEEGGDLRKDRADLINDNQGQTALIRRHVRTICEMREELERLGRTLIDVTEGNSGGSVPPKDDASPGPDIEFDFDDDDDVPF